MPTSPEHWPAVNPQSLTSFFLQTPRICCCSNGLDAIVVWAYLQGCFLCGISAALAEALSDVFTVNQVINQDCGPTSWTTKLSCCAGCGARKTSDVCLLELLFLLKLIVSLVEVAIRNFYRLIWNFEVLVFQVPGRFLRWGELHFLDSSGHNKSIIMLFVFAAQVLEED